uniref:Uncharacterized protein n=1 Tax=viral metagenome TaxID=1070528 RepID=A0A6M3XU57_9ZZZZ
MAKDVRERIYLDDCICPECSNCDSELDVCRIGRWRYPTDGCFDFVSKDNPDGGTRLENFLKEVAKSNKWRKE